VCYAYCQTAAAIQGSVIDDSSRQVSRALVVATGQSLGNHSTYSATTDPHGQFTLSNLVPGGYAICVQELGGPHLNPCQWSGPKQVTIAAGQTL